MMAKRTDNLMRWWPIDDNFHRVAFKQWSKKRRGTALLSLRVPGDGWYAGSALFRES